MKLTGKASASFYSWIHQKFDYKPCNRAILASDWFNSLHPSMQWGVYQDWADSLELYFDIEKRFDEDGYVCFGNHNFEKDTNTRQEARNVAIGKLNQLINEQ
jgi:hypothetical protein